jgi:hypothetical protein
VISASKLTGVTLKWEQQAKRLKIKRAYLQAKKKLLDDKLAAADNFTKILKWIKSADDSEPTLDKDE